MNAAARNILIGAIVVIVVALLAYFVWQEKEASEAPVSISATSTPASATSTGASIPVGASATSTAGYTVTPIAAGSAPTPPNYAAPLVFSGGALSAQEEAAIQGQLSQAEAGIEADPTDFGSWIDLGIAREEAGDYSGAAADWNYVTEIYPSDPTAYADLGNLYASYLDEPSQAIADYKEAIKLDPTQQASFYENLAQVYVSENDTADAKAVLAEGISAQVVGYQELQTELNSLQ